MASVHPVGPAIEHLGSDRRNHATALQNGKEFRIFSLYKFKPSPKNTRASAPKTLTFKNHAKQDLALNPPLHQLPGVQLRSKLTLRDTPFERTDYPCNKSISPMVQFETSQQHYFTPKPSKGRYSTVLPGATLAQSSGSSTKPSAQDSDDSAPELLV